MKAFTREQYKNALKANNLTQKAFAELTGYTVGGLQKWGNDTPVPKWAVMLLNYRYAYHQTVLQRGRK